MGTSNEISDREQAAATRQAAAGAPRHSHVTGAIVMLLVLILGAGGMYVLQNYNKTPYTETDANGVVIFSGRLTAEEIAERKKLTRVQAVQSLDTQAPSAAQTKAAAPPAVPRIVQIQPAEPASKLAAVTTWTRVHDESMFNEDSGAVIGKVKNLSDRVLSSVTMVIVDPRGMAIATLQPSCHNIPPGETFAFGAEYSDVAENQIKDLRIVAAAEAEANAVCWEIKGATASQEPNQPLVFVSGSVTNEGTKPVVQPYVYCDFFFDDGTFGGTTAGKLPDDFAERLDPGKSTPFKIAADRSTWTSQDRKIHTVLVYLKGVTP